MCISSHNNKTTCPSLSLYFCSHLVNSGPLQQKQPPVLSIIIIYFFFLVVSLHLTTAPKSFGGWDLCLIGWACVFGAMLFRHSLNVFFLCGKTRLFFLENR